MIKCVIRRALYTTVALLETHLAQLLDLAVHLHAQRLRLVHQLLGGRDGLPLLHHRAALALHAPAQRLMLYDAMCPA
jgi:hypothetical protein